jgi:hypothetical protein
MHEAAIFPISLVEVDALELLEHRGTLDPVRSNQHALFESRMTLLLALYIPVNFVLARFCHVVQATYSLIHAVDVIL